MATVLRATMGTLRQQVQQVTALVGSPEPLLKAFGTATLAYIGQTFREGGRPTWKALQPSTLAQRRAGKGSGSVQVLRDTGALASSFDMTVSRTRVVVFSNSKVGVWQHEGTRGPYPIRPKVAKALAWAGVALDSGGGVIGQRSVAGFGRGRATGRGSFTGTPRRGGKTVIPVKAGAGIIFRKGVMHPGLPPRRILPTAEQLGPVLARTGEAVVRRLLSQRA